MRTPTFKPQMWYFQYTHRYTNISTYNAHPQVLMLKFWLEKCALYIIRGYLWYITRHAFVEMKTTTQNWMKLPNVPQICDPWARKFSMQKFSFYFHGKIKIVFWVDFLGKRYFYGHSKMTQLVSSVKRRAVCNFFAKLPIGSLSFDQISYTTGSFLLNKLLFSFLNARESNVCWFLHLSTPENPTAIMYASFSWGSATLNPLGHQSKVLLMFNSHCTPNTTAFSFVLCRFVHLTLSRRGQ